MIQTPERQAAQRRALDRIARFADEPAERPAEHVQMELERILGDLLARTERVLCVAIELRERGARRIGIDAVALALGTAQRQAVVVVEQHETRARGEQQRKIPRAAAAEIARCVRRGAAAKAASWRPPAPPWRSARRGAPARACQGKSARSRSSARTRAKGRDVAVRRGDVRRVVEQHIAARSRESAARNRRASAGGARARPGDRMRE